MSTFVPYFVAMAPRVSPLATVCSRPAVTATVAVGSAITLVGDATACCAGVDWPGAPTLGAPGWPEIGVGTPGVPATVVVGTVVGVTGPAAVRPAPIGVEVGAA